MYTGVGGWGGGERERQSTTVHAPLKCALLVLVNPR